MRIALFLLACSLLLAPPAMGGNASAPELTDPPGDAPSHMDVTSAWISDTASSFVFQIKVVDLLGGHPLLHQDLSHSYRVEFTPSRLGQAAYAEAEVNGAGTLFRGGTMDGRVHFHGAAALDLVGSTVCIAVTFPPAMQEGTVVSDLRVITSLSRLRLSPLGIDRIVQDVAGPGQSYVVGTDSATCQAPSDDNPAPVPSGVSTAVVFVFDDQNAAAPELLVMPGWECDAPTFAGEEVEIGCGLDLPTVSASSAARVPPCIDPFAKAGGTFMTSGEARAYVECGGVSAGPCITQWDLSQGSCDVSLDGEWDSRLKCRASAHGRVITPGAKFYAMCGNGG